MALKGEMINLLSSPTEPSFSFFRSFVCCDFRKIQLSGFLKKFVDDGGILWVKPYSPWSLYLVSLSVIQVKSQYMKAEQNQWNWNHVHIQDCNDWVICKTAYFSIKSKIHIMDLRCINRNIAFNSPNLSVAEFAPSFSKQWLLLRVLQKICQGT